MKKQISYILAYALAGVLATTATVNAAECVTVKVADNAGYSIRTYYDNICKNGNPVGKDQSYLMTAQHEERKVVQGSKITLEIIGSGGMTWETNIDQPTWLSSQGTVLDGWVNQGTLSSGATLLSPFWDGTKKKPAARGVKKSPPQKHPK